MLLPMLLHMLLRIYKSYIEVSTCYLCYCYFKKIYITCFKKKSKTSNMFITLYNSYMFAIPCAVTCCVTSSNILLSWLLLTLCLKEHFILQWVKTERSFIIKCYKSILALTLESTSSYEKFISIL